MYERYYVMKFNEKGLIVEFSGFYDDFEIAKQELEDAATAFPEYTFIVMKDMMV